MATEVASFPALARAKRVFLQRQRDKKKIEVKSGNVEKSTHCRSKTIASTQKPTQSPQEPSTTDQTSQKCTTSVLTFCTDFDEQLRTISSDVLLSSVSVRRGYQRETQALETLTSLLLDGPVSDSKTITAAHHCVRVRRRRPRIKLRVLLMPQQKPPASAVESTPKSVKPQSRAALLAQQAVSALVLQTHCRLYLYRCSYRGGRDQLFAAAQLSKRCRQSRAFRWWRRVISQRAKFQVRRLRSQKRIGRIAASLAWERAVRVVEADGKFAMAKEFHQVKLLARCFQAWLGQNKMPIQVQLGMRMTKTIAELQLEAYKSQVLHTRHESANTYQIP